MLYVHYFIVFYVYIYQGGFVLGFYRSFSVCLSVCLMFTTSLICNFTKNYWWDLHENFLRDPCLWARSHPHL